MEHSLKQKAFDAAEKAVGLFSGLRGYVGVDLILGQKEVFVLEVNPRLTTSYVGLREVAGFNVGQAMVESVVKGKLPSKTQNRAVACFAKVQTPKPSLSKFKKTAESDAVLSPPFPLTGDGAVALLRSCGESTKEACLCLEEAKKSLRSIIS